MKTKITQVHKDFIKKNYPIKGGRFCESQLGLKKSTVSTIAKRLGVIVNKEVKIENMSKQIINVSEYIDVVNPEIAYILGLVWTDGTITFANNSSKTPIVKHTCVYYDSEASDRVFSKLNWRNFKSSNDKSIGKNRMSTNWISNRQLGEYLISQNFRDKSKGTKIYDKFPTLIGHFLRGVFDGDGCITISDSGKYKQTHIFFTSSSNQDWSFLTLIFDKLNVKWKIRKNVDKRGESSQVCINDSYSIYLLCEFMYKDSDLLRLERKYEKYNSFLQYKTQFKRNNKLNDILNGSISQAQ